MRLLSWTVFFDGPTSPPFATPFHSLYLPAWRLSSSPSELWALRGGGWMRPYLHLSPVSVSVGNLLRLLSWAVLFSSLSAGAP